MRFSLMFRFAAFVLLVLLWSVFAVAAWAEDAAAPAQQQQAGPAATPSAAEQPQSDLDRLKSYRPSPPAAAAQPVPPPEPATPKPVADAAATSIADCIDENGDFASHGKTNSFVFTADADALLADQRAWLKERDDCGDLIHGDPPIYANVYVCVRDALTARAKRLHAILERKQFFKP
jgi:hypothetical protein